MWGYMLSSASMLPSRSILSSHTLHKATPPTTNWINSHHDYFSCNGRTTCVHNEYNIQNDFDDLDVTCPEQHFHFIEEM